MQEALDKLVKSLGTQVILPAGDVFIFKGLSENSDHNIFTTVVYDMVSDSTVYPRLGKTIFGICQGPRNSREKTRPWHCQQGFNFLDRSSHCYTPMFLIMPTLNRVSPTFCSLPTSQVPMNPYGPSSQTGGPRPPCLPPCSGLNTSSLLVFSYVSLPYLNGKQTPPHFLVLFPSTKTSTQYLLVAPSLTSSPSAPAKHTFPAGHTIPVSHPHICRNGQQIPGPSPDGDPEIRRGSAMQISLSSRQSVRLIMLPQMV
jgi:hypothetical protein